MLTNSSQIIDLLPLEGLSRKESRRIEDRLDILEAATALSAEKGFEKTTLDNYRIGSWVWQGSPLHPL